MAQQMFMADLRNFFDKTHAKIEQIAEEAVRTAHGRLGNITPYRSGRARASWNVVPGEQPDFNPAPWHPGNDFDAAPEVVAAARSFYDPLYDAKHNFKLPKGTQQITLSNNVNYIELLNNGYSKQAPAAFFELTIYQMGAYIDQAIVKFGTV
jgi:hypothetical protein